MGSGQIIGCIAVFHCILSGEIMFSVMFESSYHSYRCHSAPCLILGVFGSLCLVGLSILHKLSSAVGLGSLGVGPRVDTYGYWSNT